MIQQTETYRKIKTSADGKPFALAYYVDTTIDVTERTFAHVVQLEFDRYKGAMQGGAARLNQLSDEELREKVSRQTRQYMGATLLRLQLVYVTADNVDEAIAAVEAFPTFKKWSAE